MTSSVRTLDEIRQIGLAALRRELGLVGLVRFLQMFEVGEGDYTRDRYDWLGDEDVHALAESLRQARTADEGENGEA
jgi:hypothetical protein